MSIRKVAVYNGNIQAFQYQSTSCDELELEVDGALLTEPIFTSEGVNRFCIVDGAIHQKTDDEIQADPAYADYQLEQLIQDKIRELALQAVADENPDMADLISTKIAALPSKVAANKILRV